MFKYISLILISMMLIATSCKSSKNVQNDKIAVSSHLITETVHDTVFVVKEDTSKFIATLKTDSTGKIHIDNVKSVTAGKYLKSPKVSIKNNQIEVDCYAEAQRLYHQWIEQHKSDSIVETKIVTKKVERQLTTFQSFQIWTGRIALIVIVLGLLGHLLKQYVNPFKFK